MTEAHYDRLVATRGVGEVLNMADRMEHLMARIGKAHGDTPAAAFIQQLRQAAERAKSAKEKP